MGVNRSDGQGGEQAVGESMDSDPRKLLDAALADSEAFGKIIAQTEGMVFSLAFNFFRNRSIAEDLAQDAYLELFRNLHKLESDTHLVNWLRQTVTRKCIDRSRRKKFRPHLDLDSVREPEVEAVEHDPILREELEERIKELPAKMQMVVILRFQEDLKLSEIADAMSIPVNTVKTLLRRSLIRLRPKVAHLKTEVCYAPAGR